MDEKPKVLKTFYVRLPNDPNSDWEKWTESAVKNNWPLAHQCLAGGYCMVTLAPREGPAREFKVVCDGVYEFCNEFGKWTPEAPDNETQFKLNMLDPYEVLILGSGEKWRRVDIETQRATSHVGDG